MIRKLLLRVAKRGVSGCLAGASLFGIAALSSAQAQETYKLGS